MRYVQATTADHEFTEEWERRMEEIMILVGALKIEQSSSEVQKQKEDRGEKGTPKVRKPKGSIEPSPKEQGEPSPKPTQEKGPMGDKKSRPSLLE